MLTDRAGIALLYVVLFLVNTGEVVFRSASQAMIPSVAPRDRLERANGWLFGGATLMQGMVAGPLGGFLFVVAACIPFFVNAGTYAASAVLLGLVAGGYKANSENSPRRSVRKEVVDGLRWLAHQRLLRTMAVLIGLLNVTLIAATAVLVLLAKQRLGLDSVGYGLLFTCMAVGGILGSVVGDRLIRWFTATWTIRVGLLIEAGMHLALAASRSPYLIGFALFAFGVHGSLWGIVGSSLRQRLSPPEMLGRIGSSTLFIAASGNCVGALLGGVLVSQFGLTAPYWVGFVVAIIVSATTWRVFDRATVAEAYGEATPTPQATAV
jgi:predicted MFS family arabinose efflux permease